MPRNGFVAILIACIAILTFPNFSTSAQDNLLANPGFETGGNWTGVSSGGGGNFSAPPNWGGWLSPSSISVPNGYPHRRVFVGDDATEGEIGVANSNNLFIRTGNFSANFGRGGGAFTGAIYQQASVPEGSNVQGSAWVIMNLPAGANLQARVGIDPNGGTSPTDGDIVWSNTITNQLGQFGQMVTSATATGPTVTIFLYFTTQTPVDPNAVYFDDASLSIGGAGGAVPGADSGDDGNSGAPAPTPFPTAPPVAAFVQPQGAQADGSIVHTVSAGDTLDAIAVAYGVPRAELIELNNITDPRLIVVGQRILIRPAPAADDADETTEESETTDAADAEEETSTETEEPDIVPADAETEEPADEPTNEPIETEVPAATDEAVETEEPTEAPAETEEAPATDATEETEEGGEAVAAAPTVQPTATTPAPVAVADNDAAVDPASMAASVCVGLFEDANTNRVQDVDENALAGGTIRLNRGGTEIQVVTTDGTPELYCFESLEPGEYVALADIPEGYGPTTPDQRRLRLQAGTNLNIVFGAAQGVEAIAPPPAETGDLNQVALEEPESEEDDLQQLLQYAGLVVFALAAVTLVGGVGVAFALRRR